jgi:hypothetical protein
MVRRTLRRLIPPGARHLLQSEINLVRDGGVAKAIRFNGMLADAWLRNRLARRDYNLLSESAAAQLRRSETVFVFGSGYSLNAISDAQWAEIAAHDAFGFNAFYFQQWIPVQFHLLRGGLYGELRWRPYAEEVAAHIQANPRFRDTVFVMQEEFLASFTNQLIGHRLFPPAKGVLRYATARGDGTLPTRSIREGLRHQAGTLSDAVNCAFCLGWRHIVLTGVDLYDSRYFWLPPDQTTTVDRANGTVIGSPTNLLGGNRFDDRHYTTRNGVVELMQQWAWYFQQHGVRLSVYNPRSLLADVLPVYASGVTR